MPRYSEEDIEALLKSEGFRIDKIQRVSSSVYKLTLNKDGESNKRYLKLFNPDKAEYFLRLNDLSERIGMPATGLIVTDDIGIQIMKSAEGRMLSYQLPKYLLPGVWHIYGDNLLHGFSQLGTYISTLHDQTQRGAAEISIDSLYLDKYDAVVDGRLNKRLHTQLGKDLVESVERTLQDRQMLELETSLTHGDLILRHVFYQNGSVTLIDFDRADIAGSIEDCVSFECTLDLMINRLPYGFQSQLGRLTESFYDGYGHHPESSTVTLLKLIKYCSLLLYYETKTQPLRLNLSWEEEQLTRRIDMYLLKRRIKQLSSRQVLNI